MEPGEEDMKMRMSGFEKNLGDGMRIWEEEGKKKMKKRKRWE